MLDLGCGAGRISDPLVELGHPVVAVDESAEMLAEVRLAEAVQSRIEDLALGRRFDLVLLASRLVNTPGRAARSALFGSCRRHLRPGGRLMLEWSTPEWFDQVVARGGSTGRLEPFGLELVVQGVQHDPPDGRVLAATISYRAADLTWTQSFRTERLTPEQLTGELAGHGLVGLRPAAGDSCWLLATAAEENSASGAG